MTMRKILMATAAFAVVGATNALADDDWSPSGWYIGGGAGINWMDETSTDVDYNAPGLPGPVPVEIEWDTGFVAEAEMGYRWMDNWRLEVEVSYRENDLDTFSSNGIATVPAGDIEQLAVMANLLYDFDVTDTINFSIGAGIGAAQVEVEVTGTTPGLTLFMDESDQDWTWAYQGIAGVSFETGDQTEIYIDYRYFVSNEIDITPSSTTFLPTTGVGFQEDFNNHSVKFGFRYYFEGREEVAPVVDTTTPPTDAARTYIVFFDFNKSNLTAEAQAVVAEAAEAYKSTGSVRVEVVGHTDTVGSASYNQQLSERRAASVAAEMARLGVPADAITTEGRGFSDPMVPTGPGVREPQNRRAVIDLKS